MIRIRSINKNKDIINLPKDAAFVEICDEEGNIACVISYDKISGAINIFDGASPQAERYKLFFNTTFIERSHNIDDLTKNSLK